MDKNLAFGAEVADWTPPVRPSGEILQGAYARLEPLRAATHGDEIHRANMLHDRIWDYLPYGPFADAASYADWVRSVESGTDPMFYAIRNMETGHFEGVASYLRIAPEAGSIEVGHINFSPAMQKTRAATEAMYLMMKWTFAAGYRRYEWKCNALNLGSRRAAERLGLSYEGVFRQAAVVKGRNRDTAWFAAIDAEWPALKQAFETWLSASNFDADGKQRQSLSSLTAPVLVTQDPARV